MVFLNAQSASKNTVLQKGALIFLFLLLGYGLIDLHVYSRQLMVSRDLAILLTYLWYFLIVSALFFSIKTFTLTHSADYLFLSAGLGSFLALHIISYLALGSRAQAFQFGSPLPFNPFGEFYLYLCLLLVGLNDGKILHPASRRKNILWIVLCTVFGCMLGTVVITHIALPAFLSGTFPWKSVNILRIINQIIIISSGILIISSAWVITLE